MVVENHPQRGEDGSESLGLREAISSIEEEGQGIGVMTYST